MCVLFGHIWGMFNTSQTGRPRTIGTRTLSYMGHCYEDIWDMCILFGHIWGMFNRCQVLKMPHICPYMKTCPTYVQTGRPRTIGIMRSYTHVHTESSFDYRTICPICVLTCPICVLICPICVPYVSTYVHRRLHREQIRLPHDMSHICPLICPKCVLICPICVHRRLHRAVLTAA